ncbi:MAG: TerB N-terminal domain-containing protein [Treponema sp.]|jgi:hypothetical protein|nr:TerB N-terminal domain-containing protein [Treponema sp.]
MGTEKNDPILDFPFFTLEYREGVFARRLPSGAEDLGGGRFRRGDRIYRLPRAGEGAEAESAAVLAEGGIRGRALLHLINRGPNPLIKKGPRFAEAGERIMELVLADDPAGRAGALADFPGPGPVLIEIRKIDEAAWQPLAGLPHHRYYRDAVYEIIDDRTLKELAGTYGAPSGDSAGGALPLRLLLRGEDIPRFSDAWARLVWQFGGEKLRRLMAEESVFVKGTELSLMLGAFAEKQGCAGSVSALPLVSCGGRRYSAKEVSLRMDREYLLFDRRWVRRSDLEAIGLFPLGFYAGGRPLEKIRLKPEELLRRGGERFAGFFGGFEADMRLWIDRAEGKDIFSGHLEFLRVWGLSGGVVAPGHREQAAFLVSWLARLSAACSGAADGGVLVLTERRYWELYLGPRLPELETLKPPPALPGGSCENKDAALRIAFYGDLPFGPAEKRSAPKVLVLVEPEEALLDERKNAPRDALLSEIKNIGADLVLGVFSEARELLRANCAAAVRALFGIREAGAEQYLIREIKKPLALPLFEFPQPRIRRPGEDAENSGRSAAERFRVTVESKFAGLSGPSLYSELASFGEEGPAAPFIPLRLLRGGFERMDREERAFFLYWRGEFRRGNILKTGADYIRLYARELCLFTGAGEGVRENFGELLRLWESYREIMDCIDSFLPRWIFDFACVYEMGGGAIEPLLARARQSNVPFLMDLYYRRHFIGENNSIEFGDVKPLLSGKPFTRDFEIALNEIDRFLRERFRLRLFEFFYPPAPAGETIEAFPGMDGAGRSSYTIEGIRFSRSAPFLSFLEDLYRYTEYRFKIKSGRELKGRAPPIHEAWKEPADRALDFDESAPVPVTRWNPPRLSAGPPALVSPEAYDSSPVPPLFSSALNDAALERLRVDSDAVRELLAPEADAPGHEGPRPDNEEKRMTAKAAGARAVKSGLKPAAPRLPPTTENTLRSFLENLNKTERAALALIAGVTEKNAGRGGRRNGPRSLAALARAGGAMPELLIDRINAGFLEISGDLLIDTVDEAPSIQPEYREEIKKLLGGL